MNAIRLTLPFPPSINHYWRRVGNRTLISKQGRAYRETVCAALIGRNYERHDQKRLRVTIVAYSPDKRRRDLDNMLKAPLDAMESAGVYEDDSAIDELSIKRAHDKARPRIEVSITVLQ